MKAIEKLVLRFLGSHTFSHGLGREPSSEPGINLTSSARQPTTALVLRLPDRLGIAAGKDDWIIVNVPADHRTQERNARSWLDCSTVDPARVGRPDTVNAATRSKHDF
jgi:hypothetical protein